MFIFLFLILFEVSVLFYCRVHFLSDVVYSLLVVLFLFLFLFAMICIPSLILSLFSQYICVVSKLIKLPFSLLLVQLVLSLVFLLVHTIIHLQTTILFLLQHSSVTLFQILLVHFRLFMWFSIWTAFTLIFTTTGLFWTTSLPLGGTAWTWRTWTAWWTWTGWTLTLLSFSMFLFLLLPFLFLLFLMFLASLLILLTSTALSASIFWFRWQVVSFYLFDNLFHLNRIVHYGFSSLLLLLLNRE